MLYALLLVATIGQFTDAAPDCLPDVVIPVTAVVSADLSPVPDAPLPVPDSIANAPRQSSDLILTGAPKASCAAGGCSNGRCPVPSLRAAAPTAPVATPGIKTFADRPRLFRLWRR